jgi:hypothetical protein
LPKKFLCFSSHSLHNREKARPKKFVLLLKTQEGEGRRVRDVKTGKGQTLRIKMIYLVSDELFLFNTMVFWKEHGKKAGRGLSVDGAT